MEMAKVVVAHHLLLIVLVFISGKVNGDCKIGYLATIGGGCPDKQQCLETCRPCYRGVGHVLAYCTAPCSVFPYWECRCSFLDGAPCPPPAPPQCPAKWPRGLTNSTSLNGTIV